MDKNVIEVTPDKDGKLFITLYGTKYQIVIKKSKKEKNDEHTNEHSV